MTHLFFSRQVPKVDDCIGSEVEAHIASMADGDVVLLENVRFHGDEEVCHWTEIYN